MGKLLVALWVVVCGIGCAANSPMRVVKLRCDCREEPVAVADARPELTWQLESPRRGEVQTAYQVRVTERGRKVWDSGKVEADRQDDDYEGARLEAGRRYEWQVRAWDREGAATGWSGVAGWTQGPMSDGDWRGARWIAARTVAPLKSATPNGYHSAENRDAEEEKWVQVDLGRVVPIESVTLWAACPNNYEPRTPGFGFPLRFRVEAAEEPTFKEPVAIATYCCAEYENPGSEPVVLSAPAGTRGRYVRVTGTEHWVRRDGVACFALAEMEVGSGGENVALGKKVTAKDSVEGSGWGVAGLTDGQVKSDTPSDEYAAPLMRTSFVARGEVKRATAFVCGLGYYELYLNGRKVGDHVLDPGFTAFDKRALYVGYDVTGEVRRGENALGVMLGNGWYELPTPDLFGNERARWTAPPKARVMLEMEMGDGSRQVVVSDGSWRWTTGEITYQSVRGGETHDMTKARPSWATEEASGKDWKPVVVVGGPGGKLVPQRQPAIKACGEIAAVELTEPRPGVWVYKLAENTAGWARFVTSGERGRKVTLRFGETLKKDGTIATFLASHTHGRWQVGEMVLAGTGREVYEPRFTYHGFQYVQVEGLTARPRLEDLVGVRVHTALEETGEFACSSDLLNRAHAMIRRTYLANLQSIPTDCPQREKMGWMCDGMVSSPQAMVNFDARTMYEKWVGDMEDAQGADGSMPAIVPTPGWSETGHPGEDFQCPWWGGATVVVPWELYCAYGDERILRTHYEAMRRYVDSLTARSKDGIVTFGLGDWLEVGAGGKPTRTPTELTSTAAYAYFAKIVSRVAYMMGKVEEGRRYEALAGRVREAFNRKYLREDGRYGDDTQTAPALALVLGLAPAEKRDVIARRLVENVTDVRHGHLSTGLVGTLYLYRALREIGRDDLAYAVSTAEGFPGWEYMMKSGATTLWEAWDGKGSHDHPALGAGDEWFYRGLDGVEAATPGYRSMTIRPAVVGGLSWAKASFETPQGRVGSAWRVAGGVLTLTVTVPPNARARVVLPVGSLDGVKMDGAAVVGAARDVTLLPEMHNAVAVGSGTYVFTCPLPVR